MAAPAWHRTLRARGYRLTPQRELVLDAVAQLGHATPEDICAHVRAKATAVNISTVYRTLELLEELGLVSHAHLNHGAPAYHLADDADHVHLVCRSCGKVAEVVPELVQETVDRLAADEGFSVDVRHFVIFGVCAACQSGDA